MSVALQKVLLHIDKGVFCVSKFSQSQTETFCAVAGGLRAGKERNKVRTLSMLCCVLVREPVSEVAVGDVSAQILRRGFEFLYSMFVTPCAVSGSSEQQQQYCYTSW
jgi:hypothetical protein